MNTQSLPKTATMSKHLCRALLGMTALCAAWSAQAQSTYVSAMGFRSVVPAGWTSLTRDEVRKNAKLFDSGLASMRQANTDLVKQIETEIREGRIELLFAPQTNPAFRDNINVRSTPMNIPASTKAMESDCAQLPNQMSQMFGRPVQVYACRVENLPVGKAVYLDFDGASDGIRSLQYNIATKTPGTAIQITGTFTNGSLEQQRPVFEGFIRAMKMER